MSLAKSLLGYREFWSEPEIRQMIEQSKNYDSSKESPQQAKSSLSLKPQSSIPGLLPLKNGCTSSLTTFENRSLALTGQYPRAACKHRPTGASPSTSDQNLSILASLILDSDDATGSIVKTSFPNAR